MIETTFAAACLVVIAVACVTLHAWLAFVRPRLALYAILALTPTQFIFIPLASFFVSPADVLVVAAAAGLVARLAAGRHDAWMALRLHVMLGVMVVAYLIGFLVLNHFSRTLIRVPLAIVPSILACELLVERKHFRWAIAAVVMAGLLDAGYGAYFLTAGHRLHHATRFSGMMGLNFSAIVIMAAAAMAFAHLSRTREPLKLLLPAVLALFGMATLSRMGVLALFVAAGTVLWRIATPANRRLVLSASAILLVIGISQGAVRERVLARSLPEVQLDGVERTSADVRLLIANAAWRAFGEHPFLGVGYYNFEAFSRRVPEIFASTGGAGYATHNTYLEILVEGGILAFIPFLLHFLRYAERLQRAWAVIVQRKDVVVAALMAGLVVVLVSAAAANVLLHYLFWSVCGIALAGLERLTALDTRSPPVSRDATT